MAGNLTRDIKFRFIGDATSMAQAAKRAETAMGGLSGKVDQIAGKMQSVGTTMTRRVTLPLVAGFGLAFNAASNLNEATSKANVIFEDNAEAIRQWAAGGATAFGLSEAKALDAAGSFGNMLQAQGLTVDKSADMSMALIQLAGDLASFNDASPEDMLLKLQAGLAGEAEPLRRLGVGLSAARTEAKAMELGLVGVDGSLTEAAKSQARYAIILEDTTKAQGDFARTLEDPANAMRTTKAEAENLAAAFGESLQEPARIALGLLNDGMEQFNSLSPAAKENVVKIAAGLAAFGPAVRILGTSLNLLTKHPVIMALLAIGGLAAWGTAQSGGVDEAVKDVETGFMAIVSNPIEAARLAVAGLTGNEAAAHASAERLHSSMQSRGVIEDTGGLNQIVVNVHAAGTLVAVDALRDTIAASVIDAIARKSAQRVPSFSTLTRIPNPTSNPY